MNSDSKVDVVKELILKTFYFLEKEFCYTPSFKRPNSNIYIESYEVEYVNELNRRSISVTYSKNKVFEDIKYSFYTSIKRTPYTDVQDFFSLDYFLKTIGKDYSTSMVNYFNIKDAETILKNIASSLQTYSLKLVNGDEWLERYYPRKD